MDVYRKGLTGKATEYAVKKYRSHRQIPNSIMMDINMIGDFFLTNEWTVHMVFDCICK